MATHSSVLAWKILGTAEPGRLLSMGSHSTRLKWLSSSSSSIWVLCSIPIDLYIPLQYHIVSIIVPTWEKWSHSVMSNSLRPHVLKPVRLLCSWNSPGKNTGVGIHSLLQGDLPNSGIKLGLLHRRQILYHLSHQGSPVATSVQFRRSVVSNSLQPHGLQHTRPPCPSPTPRARSNSCPSSQWRHPTISSSVVPFSFCLQSFPASGSFPMSQLFTLGGQVIGASASVLPMNIQDWFPVATSWTVTLHREHPSTLFFSRIVSAVLYPVPFHRNFRVSLSLFNKNLIGILVGILLNLSVNLGRSNILTVSCFFLKHFLLNFHNSTPFLLSLFCC